MSKFRKKKKGSQNISTASLPDIVFMLLFFFMVTTTMREVTLKIQLSTPSATQVEKLEKKSAVSFIYVGKPLPAYQSTMGTAARMQLNDKFADKSEIAEWTQKEIAKMNPSDQPKFTVSLKVDKESKMGIITDIKQELRKAQTYRLVYSARKKAEE